MPQEVQYDGKYHILSTVVMGNISPDFNTPEELANWAAEQCRRQREAVRAKGEGTLFATKQDLTCRCSGQSMGRTEQDTFRFLEGAEIATIYNGQPPKRSIVLDPERFCGLVKARTVVEAIEAKMTYEIERV